MKSFFKHQKEEQEKGFTKPNVDQILSETNLEKMKEYLAAIKVINKSIV